MQNIPMHVLLIVSSTAIILSPPPVHAQQGDRSRAADSNDYSSRADLLADRVYSKLAASGSLAGADIRVTVVGSKAVLEGNVVNEQAKQRATRLAGRVVGIEQVENKLSIGGSAVTTKRNLRVPDEELSKSIAEALVRKHFASARVERDWLFGWEVEGDGWEFEIDVDSGDVTLSGEVPMPQVIADVLRTTRSVPGVRTVTSELAADTYYRPVGLWPDWGYHPYPFSVSAQTRWEER